MLGGDFQNHAEELKRLTKKLKYPFKITIK